MIILVVGMHRSGTSMVAREMHAMGLNLGKQVDIKPDPANPNGHWEHSIVWQAQENLLTDLGREWHSSPGPLPSKWIDWPEAQSVHKLFAGIAREEMSHHGHWLVKDPRSSLLLPLWSTVADNLQVELRVLHVYRDCDEVAASLHARQGMPYELACQIWFEHQSAIERDSIGLVYARFEHRDIMRSPQTQLASMGAFCGVRDPEAMAANCAGLIEEDLWHHRQDETPLRSSLKSQIFSTAATTGVPTDRGKVLIVMRTRWRLGLLPRALRSVLAQTYRNWFLQIVNDGGPTRLVESEIEPYLHLFQGRLNVMHLPSQLGMEAASNAGIAAQDSDFIAIHDDDDSWRPEFLEVMTGWLDTQNATAGVSHSLLVREAWINGRYKTIKRTSFGPKLEQITPAHLKTRNLFPPISLLFRRRMLHNIGEFHEKLPALGDWHFNKRLAQTEPITVCPQELAIWHLRISPRDAPNSPQLDHCRAYEFVKAWPEEAPLPDFFSNARQVILWIKTPSSLVGEQTQLPNLNDPLTAPGLYLIGLDLPVTNKTLNFHYSSQSVLTLRQSLPLNCTSPDRTWILLNAPEPLCAFGLSQQGGEIKPISASHTMLRFADAVPSLNQMSVSPRLPDVLCIGAQRSGTTWLYAALQTHPNVWRWGIKEFHQFDWDGADPVIGKFRQTQAMALLSKHAYADGTPQRDQAVRMALRHAFPVSGMWENYSASLQAAPAGQLVCDFTPAYATLDENKVAEIIKVMPHIKVIFILRDPVTRTISSALHLLHRSGVKKPDVAQLLKVCESTYCELRTNYLRTLDIWERALPEDQLLVLFHEDLECEPLHWVNQICDFLRIPPMPAEKVRAMAAKRLNAVDPQGLSWPALASVKAHLSRRWLPMIVTLEQRFGEPVRQWRLAAEARMRAADTAAKEHVK
jgi:hypothetical protein